MAAHGSRTFMAHAGREVTALRYAPPPPPPTPFVLIGHAASFTPY